MIVDLTPAECQELLSKKWYAHLGCIDQGQPYVLPITYIYREGIFYGFTVEGQKMNAMRTNPSICIQVEHVENENDWQSVICWGLFQEMHDDEDKKIVQRLFAEMHGKAVLNEEAPPIEPGMKSWQQKIDEAVIYRMRPTKMTGRAERVR